MRLKITKTKSNTTYYILADYKNLDGRRSTYIYEALGNDEKLKECFGSEHTMDKV